jgi:hypothetical protein
MSEHPRDLDELRADFEARQVTLLPYDPSQAGIVPDDLRLTGSNGKSWGQLVLAVFFLLFAAVLVAIPCLRNFEDGTPVDWILALGPLFLAWRIFRGVLRRSKRSAPSPK